MNTMISHASKALLGKLSKSFANPVRTFSSVHWSTGSHVGDPLLHRPLSSLQEALYPSDHLAEPEDPRDDPCRYGYRFVYPVPMGASSFYEDGTCIGVSQRTTEDFMQETVPRSNSEDYYNASFRPEMVNETTALSPLEKTAIVESQQDWDRELLEEEMLRFVATD